VLGIAWHEGDLAGMSWLCLGAERKQLIGGRETIGKTSVQTTKSGDSLARNDSMNGQLFAPKRFVGVIK
jgi:hypothetical protein